MPYASSVLFSIRVRLKIVITPRPTGSDHSPPECRAHASRQADERQHDGQKLVRLRNVVPIDAVLRHEQPAGESLLDLAAAIRYGRLRGLHREGMSVSQHYGPKRRTLSCGLRTYSQPPSEKLSNLTSRRPCVRSLLVKAVRALRSQCEPGADVRRCPYIAEALSYRRLQVSS